MNENTIYSYTSDQAIEDGYLVDITKFPHVVDIYGKRILTTSGIANMQGIGFDKKEDDYLYFKGVTEAIKKQYDLEPESPTEEGGNDKHFFVIKFRGVQMFVADNEFGGLTVMLPEEY